jgi:hypothetical protein
MTSAANRSEKMSEQIDHVAEKHASYSVKPENGQLVRALRDIPTCWIEWLKDETGKSEMVVIERGTIKAGQTFRSGPVSNAGFRGLELWAKLPNNHTVSVSTGAVAIVR